VIYNQEEVLIKTGYIDVLNWGKKWKALF
jgi:hypothetical protein